MKFHKRLGALLLCLTAAVTLSVRTHAAGVIDAARDVRLTLVYQEQGAPIVGAQFDIYQIATVDAAGELTATETFAQFSEELRGKNDEAWRLLATTLESVILRDGLVPTGSAATDADGEAVFPTGDAKLTQGLYLVLGHQHTQNGRRYEPQPFFVTLPAQDGDWCYDVTAAVKFTAEDVPDDNDTVNRKVLKVWKDDGESRPSAVTVQLLRDGEVYDTVTLSADNSWRHTWSKLDAAHSWRVAECDVPEGYTATVSREGITFVITNTADTPTPPDTPDTPDTPDDPNNPPDRSNPPDTPDTPDTPEKPGLPQTGQLWWPVPVLTAAGLGLVVLGLLRRRGDVDEA